LLSKRKKKNQPPTFCLLWEDDNRSAWNTTRPDLVFGLRGPWTIRCHAGPPLRV